MEKLSNMIDLLGPEIQAGGTGNNTGKPPVIDHSADDYSLGKKPTPGIIVGLDIGTTKIVAAVGRESDQGKIELIGVGEAASLGVIRGTIFNISKTTHSIKMALLEAFRRTHVKIDLVNVSLSGSQKSHLNHGILTRSDPDEEIRFEDIQKLKQSMQDVALPAGETIVYMHPQEFIVDDVSDIKDPIGMCGRRIEADFRIATGSVSSVNNLRKTMVNAGLRIRGIYPTPLASGESILSQEEREAGVALVEIGGSTTSIIVYHHQIIRHVEVIPLGGSSITLDIKNWLHISLFQAELLKKEFGNALENSFMANEFINAPTFSGKSITISKRNLAYLIQARMEEIVALAFYSIKSSGYATELCAGIVLTGGTSLLPGIRDLTESMTGLRCYIGSPDLYLAPNRLLPVEVYKQLLSPAYSTVIGLVKIGLDNKI